MLPNSPSYMSPPTSYQEGLSGQITLRDVELSETNSSGAVSLIVNASLFLSGGLEDPLATGVLEYSL